MSEITLTTKLPYEVSKKDTNKDNPNTDQELTQGYISMVVGLKYQKGLDSQWRKTWGNVQRKLDKNVENEEESISLEESEFDFIKRAVLDEKIEIPAHISKYFLVLENEIDRIVDERRSKEKKKAEK